ncbi:class I SAM-dependent methyltransferase [Alicyclobacillus acidocaldarius]|uniref:Methyltransferase type 11 n=1 Tax=Alicyclobacillus acidocaldarius (strain Tc-4-1) TaxID=1048834 RepID=F8IEI0_ALIAT|nr:methyltransferase domain-containing protein [Alicyclobacillus acidocaldarius]AEJ42694.1 Methyltransferase type 11 [Alicyclobacillus acidocaldarius subsp. acidocaldarius Tc-4-1]
MPHVFRPEHAARLVGEERERLLPPDRIIDAMKMDGQEDVVDIGAGPGFFALPLARRTQGTVYAVDLSPEMLAMLSERARQAGLDHVQVLEATADQLPLPDESVHRALMAFVLHEVPDQAAALREVYRVLRPGGRFLLLEWDKRPMEMGPPVEERLSIHACEEALRTAGFEILHRIFPNDVHYGIVAERPGRPSTP